MSDAKELARLIGQHFSGRFTHEHDSYEGAVSAAADIIAAHDAALRAERDRLREAAKAYQELVACYRIGRTPSDKLFKRLEDARAAIKGEA